MAATIACTLKDDRPRHGMAVLRVDWACDTGSSAYSVPIPIPIYGSMCHIVSKPGAIAPTDISDVALIGEDGADRLQGSGADAISASVVKTTPTMTEATVSSRYYGVNPSIGGFVTLTISNNTVNGANGTLWFYFR